MTLRTVLLWAPIAVVMVVCAMTAVPARGEEIVLCPIADDWEPGSDDCPCEPSWRPPLPIMQAILERHRVWMETVGPENPLATGRAILCNAFMTGFDLDNADLSGADMRDADLTRVGFRDALLVGADLSGATLVSAWPIDADLRYANLSGADLGRANLTGVNLHAANLSEARLFQALLPDASLREANLSGAMLVRAILSDASLRGANLAGAELQLASLQEANLAGANLSGANLSGVDASRASFTAANLSGANLTDANLSGTRLIETVIEDARFSRVDLSGSTYEPSSAPSAGSLTGLRGLVTVHFDRGEESGLILLRNALQEAGLRPLERTATYTIERGRTLYMITEPRGPGQWLGGLLRLVFFEWTTGYGLHPPRALVVLLSIMAGMTVVYAIPVSVLPDPAGHRPATRDDVKGGIYRIWPAERIVDDDGGLQEAGSSRIEPLTARGPAVFGYAFHFSVLSAFHIGWRELNVGSWVSRIQSREYTLRARGWVRVVSGIQSLVSVYLLAIWVLTYFGRPFQ